MPSNSAQTRIDRNSYIPPNVQQAMTQHMAHSMPQHLKKYVGSNAAYMPQSVQANFAKEMQKTMPTHLKQYAGAYMQQQVVQPNTTRLRGPNPGPRETFTPPPTPDKLRRGHSIPGSVEQATVELNTLPNDKSMFQAEQPPANTSPTSEFDFFLNDGQQQPPKKSLLPSSSSLPVRIAIFGGGLVILLIVFTVVKGLISGSSPLPAFVSIAEDQQDLIHIVSLAAEQQDLSTTNQNFAATAQLSLTSSQAEIVEYISNNGKKVNPAGLEQAIDTKVDARLEAAATAETYDQTFRDIMKAKLSAYANNLQSTYQQTDGEIGQALLIDQFDQAKLLLTQLEATKS